MKSPGCEITVSTAALVELGKMAENFGHKVK